MKLPKIVVFDLGKVLVDFDFGIAARKIAARGSMAADEIQAFIEHSPLPYRFETGLITRQEFFDEVRRATSFRGTIDEFSGFFADIFWEIPLMIEIQGALRKRGIPTYVFSNTNDLAIAHIRRNFPFFAGFNGYILSYEIKAMKPNPKIYEALELMAGKRGAEILYLDDRKENVDAGAARGWQVILQESPEKSLAALKKSGLLSGN
jgi:FMN phosphatase YigB (HAD superfamily)